jgi:hypothetical protein
VKYTYQIETCSEFDNRAVHSDSPNMNAIYDKLLRITAKLTESCAGDILSLFPAVQKALDNGVPFDAAIMFLEGGVQWKEIDADDTITMDFHTRYLQVWCLNVPGGFDAGAEASLERVVLVYRDQQSTETVGCPYI